MKPLNVILGVLGLAAATLAVPALLASIVAGAVGLLMLATAGPMPVLFPWFKRCKLFARSKSPRLSMFSSWTAVRVLSCFARSTENW